MRNDLKPMRNASFLRINDRNSMNYNKKIEYG